MGNNNTIEIITKDIEELEKIVSNLKNYSRIPRIELDLALGKMQNIYELMLMLKEADGSSSGNLEKENPPAHEDIKKDKKETGQPAAEEDLEKPETKESEYYSKEHTTPVPGKKKEVQKEKEETKNEKKEKILAEKYEKPGDYINEKIGVGKTGNDLSSRMQTTPIKSIAGSLGINDKFYFIRELFGGNAEEFRSAMGILDEASNFNEAYNYILNHFDWDMDSDTVQQLLTLVRRKFISPKNG